MSNSPASSLNPVLVLLVLGVGLVLACGSAVPPDFGAAVKERVEAYEALYTDPEALLAGPGEIHERLEALVPDAEKSAADHFVLGNLLYRLDPARSYTHHAAAFADAPEEPAVMLEMAYQHQRRGDCHQAGRLYQKLAAMDRLSPELHALWAHCLLVVGRHAEAVEAWQTAAESPDRAKIGAAIHQVFGEVAPLARHDRLMRRVTARDEAAVGEVLGNALSWQEDWWDTSHNLDAFHAAVATIEASFGAESPTAREVSLFAQSLETPEAEAFAALLREAGLLLDDGGLPRSSYVAKEWMGRLLNEKLASAEQLSRFLPVLDERARSGEDADALAMAAALRVRTGRNGELEAFERLGWETYRKPRYALSLLARRKTEKGELAHDDPVLRQALADFPDNPMLARAALVLATNAGVDTADDVARLIAAEYHGLESDRKRGPSFLNSYYDELAKRLETETAAASPADG